MKVLHIDIETYSDEDLSKTGVYKYAESEKFEILLFAFAYNDESVTVVDLARGQKIPDQVLSDLTNPDVTKCAHNASFERVCLSEYLRRNTDFKGFLNPDEWECTMVRALTLGLPASLKGVGLALKLPEDKAKDKEGGALIRYFCGPCKPTKVNGRRLRNYPFHDPAKWKKFIEYNRRDVVAEQEIYKKLKDFPILQKEKLIYSLDQRINDYGILAEDELLNRVSEYAPSYTQDLSYECVKICGAKPTQVLAIKTWLNSKLTNPLENIGRKTLEKLLETCKDKDACRVAEIRLEAGTSSVAKYQAFKRAQCKDHRIHGAFQYYGASHTGRWAGRLVQPQNFPRNEFSDYKTARDLVLNGDFEALKILYPSLTGVFKTLARTIVIAPENKTLAVADYSAIEARVIAWLAGEKWRSDVFKNGGDIYCASASQMFHVPVEKHGLNSHLRKKGKIAELALGYAGGVGALKAFGAEAMGLSESDMQGIVHKWRDASPKIVKFWYDVEEAAKKCIETAEPQAVRNIRFTYSRGFMFIQIPSGRKLAYPKARLELNDFNKMGITYFEMNQVTKKWDRVYTRGGKLVENICQAVARDCLAEAMLRIEKEYPIVMHVHDEVIVEVPKENAKEHLDRIAYLMSNGVHEEIQIPWAKGLLLTAEGFTSDFYKKD